MLSSEFQGLSLNMSRGKVRTNKPCVVLYSKSKAIRIIADYQMFVERFLP